MKIWIYEYIDQLDILIDRYCSLYFYCNSKLSEKEKIHIRLIITELTDHKILLYKIMDEDRMNIIEVNWNRWRKKLLDELIKE